jgi:ABC-2 type transport system ATP-binding protein
LTNRVPAAITIDGLRVVRGGKLVLPGISVEIPARRVTGLLGPSGSGKTTLIRAIVGVQILQDGRVDVLGAQAGSPGLRSRVGYMTQSPSVYPDLTVAENLRFFGSILGVDLKRIDAVVATVGLEAQVSQIVSTLSGGERSRTSLAVALLNDPDVLVLDEPTVGLDPVLRRDLWNTFHKLAEAGATLLVSSHVMDEADRCDLLVLLHEGQILATGTPDDLRARTGADDLEQAFLRLVEEGS